MLGLFINSMLRLTLPDGRGYSSDTNLNNTLIIIIVEVVRHASDSWYGVDDFRQIINYSMIRDWEQISSLKQD